MTGVLILLLLSACSLLPAFEQPTRVPPAAEMLPDLPGYTIVEGQTLTSYISTLSGGAALLAGQPELAAMVAAVDRVISCYQQVGAARARIYSDQANPLSAGTVAIADRNALLDPVNIFKCVVPKKDSQIMTAGIQPCSATFTLSKGGNEYYILYAGTTTEICQAFCTRLEGCTAHRP